MWPWARGGGWPSTDRTKEEVSTVAAYAPGHWGDAAEVAILPPTYRPQPYDRQPGVSG